MEKKTYDATFKKEAIRLVEEQGEKAFPGKDHLKPDDAELRRLKRENEELREENEILKNAAAIFAKHQR